ncbi:MAG: hypothetical protein ACREDZ_04035 [Kiloniellales bacterium]
MPASFRSASTRTRTTCTPARCGPQWSNDLAVYEGFQAARSVTWQAGFRALGLAEQGVDWALDEHNAALIDEARRAEVEAARQAIVAGEITVHNYMSDNACRMTPEARRDRHRTVRLFRMVRR